VPNVNTVRYAQKLTGIEQISVIIGGFHLGGLTPEPLIQQTCIALAAFAPAVIAPTHCIGSGRFIAWQPCSLTPSSRAASEPASSCRCQVI
jgi:metal-dependent hydrolase (beta-lactamase superfamily II)